MSDTNDPIALRQSATLSTLIAERMEGSILSGGLPAGSRINEVTLAKEYGVSRGPVREAARLLASRGLVEFIVNKGAFVREVDADEMLEIYSLRALLTGHACERAAGAAPEGKQVLLTMLKDMDEAAAASDAEAYYDLNLDFHDRLNELAQSPRLTEMLSSLIREMHLFRQVSLARYPDMTRSNIEHKRIVDAIMEGDSDAARRAGEAHVRAGMARFQAAFEASDQINSPVSKPG
ncbi:MAG: GntR family transcriptional regulator [Hyphomicrobiales bacterium]